MDSILSTMPAIVPSVILFVELFCWLPVTDHLKAIKSYSSRAVTVIHSKKISDHWKEKVLPAYSLKIMASSLSFGFYLLLLLVAFVFVYIMISFLLCGRLSIAVASVYRPEIQVAAAVVGLLYAVLRKRLSLRGEKKEGDYSLPSKIFHQMALGSTVIKEVAFDLDCLAAGTKRGDSAISSPVYIAGLARGGTTIFLEALYNSGAFTTLTYRDMPFVMAPYLWSRISQRHQQFSALKERAHGDRLYVNYDSPEAFEEVFWKTFFADRYIFDSYLGLANNIDDELIEKYRQFIGNIICRQKVNSPTAPLRYLAKNNNNVLRIDSIKKAFPDSLIMVPFRRPLDQAGSLQAQHKRFLKIHQQDPFSLKYMNWLGHFEFGMNFKPFNVGDDVLPESPEELVNLDFWLHYWKNVYSYILEKHASQVVFFDYNRFCEVPAAVLRNLEGVLRLEQDSLCTFIDHIKPAKTYSEVSFGDDLPDSVKTVYKKLKSFSVCSE